MIIKVLGTRGEIAASLPYHSRHSGVLVDNKFLFDWGEENFIKENPQAVFITHLHPDHAFFVRRQTVPQLTVSLFTPKNYHRPRSFAGYRITPFPTHHSKFRSQAYLIEKQNKKIIYTGDLVWLDKKYQQQLPPLDLVITEASFLKKGGMIRKDKETGLLFGHNGIPDLIHLFKKFTAAFLLVHFGSWFYKNTRQARRQLQDLASKEQVKIIVGYDGLVVKV